MTKRSLFQWLLEVVALTAVCGSLFLVLSNWTELPDRIPTHYSASGAPNSWGGKGILWLLTGMNAGLYVLMTAAARYQKLINIPLDINRDAPEVKQLLAELAMVLKVSVTGTLTWIIWRTTQTALGQTSGLGSAFFAVCSLVIVLPLIIYIARLRKYRN